jgi:hypothetical protein
MFAMLFFRNFCSQSRDVPSHTRNLIQKAHHTAIRSGLSLPFLLMILPFLLMIPARFLSQLAFLELNRESELDANKSARPMEEPCRALGFECIS